MGDSSLVMATHTKKLAIHWLVSCYLVIVRCCMLYYAIHYAVAVTNLIYLEQTMYCKKNCKSTHLFACLLEPFNSQTYSTVSFKKIQTLPVSLNTAITF